jgi:hypothetical protein
VSFCRFLSQDPAKFNLIGCFKDMVDNIRDLPVMTMQSNKMEPNLCMGQCRSLSFKCVAQIATVEAPAIRCATLHLS